MTAAKALVVLTAADQTETPARFCPRAALDVVVSLSAAADAMAPPAPAVGGARGGDHDERGRLWKKADFPTDDALRKCRVYRHEDLPRHIYLLLDILGLQFRWVLTRFGRGRALVSEAEQLVDD